MKIELELRDDLILEVTGEYYPEELPDREYAGLSERFNLSSIKYIKGTEQDLIEYIESEFILNTDSWLEEECLKQINNELD